MNTYYRPQLTPVTCYAACLQMVLAKIGVRIGHIRAIIGLGNPYNGITAEQFEYCLSVFSGGRLHLVERKSPLNSLKKGNLVVSYISIRNQCDHAVVISDFRKTKSGTEYFVLDPLPWKIGWKTRGYFDDFFFEVNPA